MSAAEAAPEEEVELDLGNSDVCTKYREAGRIASLALQGIKSQVRGVKGVEQERTRNIHCGLGLVR